MTPAREILASIFDEDGMSATAQAVREGKGLRFNSIDIPLRAIDAALAASPKPTTVESSGMVETWESVAAWCEETFGPCTPFRMVERADEEMGELRDEVSRYVEWTDKARIEAADVLICLSRVPGIWAAVEEKMAINRARRWDKRGDGTGYHIKDSASSPSSEQGTPQPSGAHK